LTNEQQTDGQTDGRTTLEHIAFATCCWRWRHKGNVVVLFAGRRSV